VHEENTSYVEKLRNLVQEKSSSPVVGERSQAPIAAALMGALPPIELWNERLPVLFVDACDALEDEEV
jgi:hypothetical protein